ncbi:MAG: hypothetical protein WBM44_08310 [Waterburya sp.]
MALRQINSQTESIEVHKCDRPSDPKSDRLSLKSKYIPKRLITKVERMNDDQVPVQQILNVLRNRSKSQREK